MELYQKTAHELHELLVSKEISSTELTQSIFARIDEAEDTIGAYTALLRDSALEKAAEVDKKIAAGDTIAPLAGIPVAIKDNICLEGTPTTCSSKMLDNFVPPYDATVITKLRAQDAVFTGKTNMDEFAMGNTTETAYRHKTKNSWNTDYVPGGSSGGSAACVGADEAIAALGSDTGGSIRQPAAFCGVVGLKPTYGTVSRSGVVAFASSLDQVGPLTKDVTDSAILLNALTGYDPKETTSRNITYPDFTQGLRDGAKGLTVGLPKEYLERGVSDEAKKAVLDAAAAYEKLGATVKECSLPMTEYALPVYQILSAAEASSNLARFDGIKYGYQAQDVKDLDELYKKSRSEAFGAEVKRRIMLGAYTLSAGYYDAYYKKALQVRTLVKQDFDTAFESFDLLITPTTPDTAWKLGGKMNPMELYAADICTVAINIAGVPALSLPYALGQNGMPLGVQLISKPLSEATLLRAAFALEGTVSIKNPGKVK